MNNSSNENLFDEVERYLHVLAVQHRAHAIFFDNIAEAVMNINHEVQCTVFDGLLSDDESQKIAYNELRTLIDKMVSSIEAE